MKYLSDIYLQDNADIETVHAAPEWNENNVSSSEFMSALKSLVNFASPADLFSASLTSAAASTGLRGGVMTPAGVFYSSPTSGGQIWYLDTNSDTGNYINSPFDFTGYGGVLASNGFVYILSVGSTRAVKINTTDNSYQEISTTARFRGSVFAPNGKIYGMPQGSSSVGIIDTLNNDSLSTLIAPASGTWNGGVLAPNGIIYGIPSGSANILRINTTTNTTLSFITAPASGTWNGGVLAPNGNIYAMPNASTSILVINTLTNTTSSLTAPVSGTWNSGALAPNGIIYGMPNASTTILRIDPSTNSVTTVTAPSSGTWNGAVLAPNGSIYGIPSGLGGYYLKIDVSSEPIPVNIACSRYLNKY